jgi:hypothetical protein
MVEMRLSEVCRQSGGRTPLPVEDNGRTYDGNNPRPLLIGAENVIWDLVAVKPELEQHVSRNAAHSPGKSSIVPEKVIRALVKLMSAMT